MPEPQPDRTATGRRPAIDVVRILALLLVVIGHLSLAVIDRHAGHVRGANLLALHPGWAWVASLAPMPVFFAAGGWANATAAPASAATRARTLVGLGAVVVTMWALAVVVTVAITGEAGVVGDGARIATQPLWFLAAYVPLAVAGGFLGRVASRHGVGMVAGCLVTLAALDLARFAFDAPRWIGWPGFFLAWGAAWVAGAWWRARYESGGFDEQRVGLLLAVGAGIACVGLVHFGGYAPALIDAVPHARSNTTPPTLYTAVAGLTQVGLVMILAPWLDRVGLRWPRLWARAGEVAVGVYIWHLTALALCAAVIAAGLPTPDRLTALWWVTRPVWWLAVLGVTVGLVVLTASVRTRLSRGSVPTGAPTTGAILGAVVLAVAAGALIGLRGPRTATLAISCAVLFIASWLMLRPRRAQLVVRSGEG